MKKLIKFTSKWCASCKAITLPEVQGIENEIIDVEDSPKIAMQYQVRSLPTIVFLHNGNRVNQIVGAVDAHTLNDAIEKLRRL